MISIRITKHAAEDLDQAFWFYENQEIGLGDYFSSSVRADIEGLRITSGIHRRLWEDYHRLICKVFPFAVYYTFSADEVAIWAVVDCRRDPDWIRRYLDG